MPTSKIKSVQGAGDWTPEGGDPLYKFEYDMEDGTIFTAFHKKQAPLFEAGAEVEYEITKTGTKGKSGKVRKPGQAFNAESAGGYKMDPKTQRNIENSWALRTAVLAEGPIPLPNPNTGELSSHIIDKYWGNIKSSAKFLLTLRDTLHE